MLWSMVLMTISNSHFLYLRVLRQLYLSSFPLFCHTQHCSLDFKMLFDFSHYFLASILLLYWIQRMVLAILIDQIIVPGVLFLIFNLIFSVLNKVESYCSKFTYFFLSKKLGTNLFYNYQYKYFIDQQDNQTTFLFFISSLSGAKG